MISKIVTLSCKLSIEEQKEIFQHIKSQYAIGDDNGK